MFFIKKSMAALGFSLALAGSAQAVTLSYGKVDAATFEQAVAAYRDDPTYLVNNQALLRALTPEQLSQAIEKLDLTHGRVPRRGVGSEGYRWRLVQVWVSTTPP